jgi:ferrochelatase
MRFREEPRFRHGQAGRVGVLLCNLGTPEAATTVSVRRYLAQFLSDPRVVEIPALLWKPILYGIILQVRPAKSAAKYASVWTPEGSPLAVWTAKQAALLQGYLGERGAPVVVQGAMRYGEPSIPAGLDKLRAQGVDRILVFPLYPQYSGATTASTFDAVYAWASNARFVPEFRFLNHYHGEAGYIDALAESVRAHWRQEGRGSMLVMSFHGMPERTLVMGDPYHCECHVTARKLAEKLGLTPGEFRVTFQSRFGKAKWLEPATEPTLIALAAGGQKRVDVICPGFAADCLETLEEISQEGRDAFLQAGGSTFHYIACLNDRHEGMVALAGIAMRHLQGWELAPPSTESLAASRERALAEGAPD